LKGLASILVTPCSGKITSGIRQTLLHYWVRWIDLEAPFERRNGGRVVAYGVMGISEKKT
jgi:hypothetical protein